MTPIREFFSWPGKRNYEGLYWSSTSRAHVDFESLLEREYLMAADHAPDIVAIAAQPLALLWPHGTLGHREACLLWPMLGVTYIPPTVSPHRLRLGLV